MQDADQGTSRAGGQQASLHGAGLRIGIVQARFNTEITDGLAKACKAELAALGVTDVIHHTVPGALEVPLVLQALGDRDEDLDALIALGCIIRGETYHFELVANESGAAITRIGLDLGLPIANAILTVETEAQAWARIDKGRDAARVAVEMANLLKESL